MNKSLIKFITDFGPLLIFFFFYYDSNKDLKVAIPPFIIATIISLVLVWFLEKKIPMVPLLGGVLITFFGGLTIYFDNPVFIYIKPTIINLLFGLALLFGKLGYIWLFLVNPDSSNCQLHCQQSSVYLQQPVVASAEVLEKSQFFQKYAKYTLTLMSNYEIYF